MRMPSAGISMDFTLSSDLYKNFRERLLGASYAPDEIFTQIGKLIAPIAKELHIGYIDCELMAPVSPLSPTSIDEQIVIYHDKERLPTLPDNKSMTEVMSTGEQGTYSFDAHPIEGHDFTDSERSAIQLIFWDSFVLAGRARLMGMVQRARLTDYMTGAHNQAGLMRFGSELLAQRQLKYYSGIFINLKNFKYINRSKGSQVGDMALKIFVNNVKKFLDEKEVIARLGGDNFYALVKKDRQSAFIQQFTNQEVNLSQGLRPLSFQIQARMGVYPVSEKDTMAELMSNAALALNTAKSIKTEDVIHFRNDMLTQALHQREVSSEFSNSLRNEEFIIYYQPKVSLQNKQLCGAEALVRWVRHKMILPPTDFIPILEREGSICQLDFFVFESVCRDIHDWIEKGIEPVRTSTNFSKLHLRNPNFADFILAIMRKFNVDSKYLEVELTEVSDYDDFVAMQKFVNTMRKNGISVSIDDFGTGYSTLNVIKDFNVNVIKLDKSLLDNIGLSGSQDEIVVKNVVNMAAELNKEVIAEGVENEEQARFLAKINCHKVQGFLFDKPLSHDDFEKRLSAKQAY